MMTSRTYKGVHFFTALLQPRRAKAPVAMEAKATKVDEDDEPFDPANSEDEWDDDDDE